MAYNVPVSQRELDTQQFPKYSYDVFIRDTRVP
jgi:hypothetical protein